MKSQQRACVAFLCALPAASPAVECTQFREGSTPWATCQSAQTFENADRSLGTIYGKVLATLDKRDRLKERQALIESQQTWISFREKQCEFEQKLAGGAGDATLMDCKATLTDERRKFLERVLRGER